MNGASGVAEGSGASGAQGRRVALFVTCLADSFRPGVAEGTVRLLEEAGCVVSIPLRQSCCGQPGYNSGDYGGAVAVAKQVIEVFEGFPHVVLPSGSCAGMLREHFPRMLSGEWRDRALALAARVFELTQFLDEVVGFVPQRAASAQRLAYHDGCAGLRELRIREQPRRLLASAGHEIRELEGRDVCCGFGGTFCARMPRISAKMADDKLAAAQRSGAATLVGGDLGCLLALAGRSRRQGLDLRFRHVAEVLAGDTDSRAIGEPAAD